MFVNANCNWQIRKNHFNLRTMRVNFEKGYIYTERGGDRQAAVKVLKTGEETTFMEKLPLDGYYEEIKYFIVCLENGKKPDFNPLEQSLDNIKIVMKEIESSDKDGARIEI